MIFPHNRILRKSEKIENDALINSHVLLCHKHIFTDDLLYDATKLRPNKTNATIILTRSSTLAVSHT